MIGIGGRQEARPRGEYSRRRHGGFLPARRGGVSSCGSLGINDSDTHRLSKEKRTRQRESRCCFSRVATKTRVQGESRSSAEACNRWMSLYKDQAPTVVHIVMEAWSAIFAILILLEGHHLFGYVRLCWIAHPYHGQMQKSRSSRCSSGRIRTGSGPATIGGKSMPTRWHYECFTRKINYTPELWAT